MGDPIQTTFDEVHVKPFEKLREDVRAATAAQNAEIKAFVESHLTSEMLSRVGEDVRAIHSVDRVDVDHADVPFPKEELAEQTPAPREEERTVTWSGVIQAAAELEHGRLKRITYKSLSPD